MINKATKLGNLTECFGDLCKKRKNNEQPRIIKHGEKRYFSMDQSTNNCQICRVPEQVLEMNSNGDEVFICVIVLIKLHIICNSYRLFC
jgi:hypothetical protein